MAGVVGAPEVGAEATPPIVAPGADDAPPMEGRLVDTLTDSFSGLAVSKLVAPGSGKRALSSASTGTSAVLGMLSCPMPIGSVCFAGDMVGFDDSGARSSLSDVLVGSDSVVSGSSIDPVDVSLPQPTAAELKQQISSKQLPTRLTRIRIFAPSPKKPNG